MSEKIENSSKSTERRISGNDVRSTDEPSYTNTQEPLPSYEHEPSPPSNLRPTSTAASLRAPSIPSESATQISSTVSQFLTTIPPPYTPSGPPHQILFAIPQTNPTLTSPLLFAYPPTLSTYGITLSTWSSFLHQISTHLAARTTSKRLLSHASDVAVSVPRKLGKNLIHTGTAAKENLSKSAKQLNPFGVVNSVVGFTFGVTGALVGSIVGVPGTIVGTRPRTQMERVGEFLEERNARWLHERGLHGEVVGMGELSGRVGCEVGEILGVAGMGGDSKEQMGRLREWVGEVVVGGDGGGHKGKGEEGIERRGRRAGDEAEAWRNMDRKDRRSFVRGAQSVGFNITGNLSVDGQNSEQGEIPVAGSSVSVDSAGEKGEGQVLVLGQDTLWLVFSSWENK